jgi:hypothetical protein
MALVVMMMTMVAMMLFCILALTMNALATGRNDALAKDGNSQ